MGRSSRATSQARAVGTEVRADQDERGRRGERPGREVRAQEVSVASGRGGGARGRAGARCERPRRGEVRGPGRGEEAGAAGPGRGEAAAARSRSGKRSEVRRRERRWVGSRWVGPGRPFSWS